jgi:hypothetical protein
LIRASSENFGVRKSVGAGLLAKAVGQVRPCHGAIFFAGKRAPTVDPGTSENFGVRKSVGAGLLAKAVGQVRRCHGAIFFAGKRAPTVDPGKLGKLRRAQICRSRLANAVGL